MAWRLTRARNARLWKSRSDLFLGIARRALRRRPMPIGVHRIRLSMEKRDPTPQFGYPDSVLAMAIVGKWGKALGGASTARALTTYPINVSEGEIVALLVDEFLLIYPHPKRDPYRAHMPDVAKVVERLQRQIKESEALERGQFKREYRPRKRENHAKITGKAQPA